MKVTTIINGVTQLILQPENDLEKEILKKLNGATTAIISENNSVLSNNVGGGLLIRPEQKDNS